MLRAASETRGGSLEEGGGWHKRRRGPERGRKELKERKRTARSNPRKQGERKTRQDLPSCTYSSTNQPVSLMGGDRGLPNISIKGRSWIRWTTLGNKASRSKIYPSGLWCELRHRIKKGEEGFNVAVGERGKSRNNNREKREKKKVARASLKGWPLDNDAG